MRGNDTMSASSKKKLRAEESASKLTEKQLSERKEARKLRIYTIAFGVALALMVLAFIWINVSQSITKAGVREKNTVALTVGEHKINSVEMSYFYIDSINNFYSQYGSSAAIFGLDTTTPLDQQVIDEESGRTWADDFLESAQGAAQSIYASTDAASAAGFTLPQDAQDQVDQYGANLDTYARVYGFSNTDAYLRAMYGNGASRDSYMDYYTRNVLASAYQTEYRSGLNFSDEEIAARDAEDPTAYNSYSFHQYYLATSRFLTGGTTDENGSTTYSDAERAAAEAAAKAAAASLVSDSITSVADLDEAIAGLSVNAEATSAASTAYTDTLASYLGSTVADWIKDSARKPGDKTYLASTSTSTADDGSETTRVNGYYVVYFEGASRNTFPLANVRHILIQYAGGTTDANGNTTYSDEEKAAAMTAAQEILEQWKSGDHTEDSFAALATEKSEDPGSKDNGGLYENVYPGEMVTAFNDWCFDSSRKAGDTGIVETNYGCHVMYYSGDSDISYRTYMVTEALRSDAFNQWKDELLESTAMTPGDSKYIRRDLVLNSQG